MMRFKAGARVEVLDKRDVPSGAWRCSEIVCGNGHYYTVRYDGSGGEMELKRISRKEIRPCPPVFEISDAWVPGDVVEVFDDFSWKMATITKAFGKSKTYFLVRVLGSTAEFKASSFDIRPRQSWQGDEWVVIGKGTRGCKDKKPLRSLHLKNIANERNTSEVQLTRSRKVIQGENAHTSEVKKGDLQKPKNTVCKIVKRGAYVDSQAEAFNCTARKYRAVERGGRPIRLATGSQSLLSEEVVAFAFPSQAEFSDVDAERRQLAGAAQCSPAADLESSDADSDACSVGSCSIDSSNKSNWLHHCAGRIEYDDGNSSDAESFCQREDQEPSDHPLTKEQLASEIHRLELYAYRCTMEALHASGPLSWEQEEMVTNLRLSLHISNDEHLVEGQPRRPVYLNSKVSRMILGFAAFSWSALLAIRGTQYDGC